MTTEQYNRLSQFADDFDSAIREYYDNHRNPTCEDEDLTNALEAAVNMMHLIKQLPIPKFVKTNENEFPF